MAKTPTKAAAKPRAKPKLVAETLTRLANRIEELKGTRLTDLVHELETENGAKIADKGTRGTVVKLAGIETSSMAGVHMALTNWGNAARRAVRTGEAV